MKTIYKYTLDEPVRMPRDATVVKVGIQDGIYCIWAVVDTVAPVEERRFVVVGTGRELDSNMIHVGTVFEGPFVWHIMELTNERAN
jgi:hypothetical protein